MRQFHFGEIISGDVGALQFTIPKGVVLIWRNKTPAEAVLCESDKDIPSKWKFEKNVDWKIFGTFESIKTIFPNFDLPAGSKVIDLSADAVIQMNTLENRVRFLGKRKKRVLIVDDSATIRKLLKHIIDTFEDWEVAAEVERAEDIPAALLKCHPDLVTLDLHLGKVNGVEAMKRFLAPKKFPTLIITSQPKKDGGLVMEALEAGALDYLQKPESGKWDSMMHEMLLKMETALKSRWQENSPLVSKKIVRGQFDFNPEEFLIAIGSSTGGTQALQSIFTSLPEVIPPIIVTQHIPAGFSKALADRLNSMCPFEIKEAEDGDEVRAGRVLIAPGDHHLKLSKSGKTVQVVAGEPVNRFRPSVEVMFKSVGENSKKNVIAVMLTGMGKDGAEAMLELRKKGALTVAQDEASCVVFGMPKEAIRIGGAQFVKPLNDIPDFIIRELCQKFALKKES